MTDHDHYRLATLRLDVGDQVLLRVDQVHYALETLLARPVSVLELLQDWQRSDTALGLLARRLRRGEITGTPVNPGQGQWRPPVMFPRKLVIVGLNYRDHASEMGAGTLPEKPYLILKPASTSLVGAGTEVRIPANVRQADYEAELGVVIGTRTRSVPVALALDSVAGYSVLNDLSARDWINQQGPLGVDWLLQKGHDQFTPMGPYLTPARFVLRPQDLRIRLWVNGELRQDSSTRQMIASVAELVAYASSIMTLEPGDVLATGTPSGVGRARRPPCWLADGDKVAIEIDGLGLLEHQMTAERGGP